MNYTVWIQPVASELGDLTSRRVRWVSKDFTIAGEVTAVYDAASAVATDVIQQLEAEDRETLVSYHDWEEHGEELAVAWQKALDLQQPATPPKHELKVLRDQHHICPNCVVYEACVVGQATLAADAMLTTVNACLGYQPQEEI